MLTLTDLHTILADASPSMRLVVTLDGVAVASPFHITEIRHLTIDAVDCGGRQSRSAEAEMELLPGGGRPLTAGVAASIVAACLDRVPGLADAPLKIRHNDPGAPLSVYEVVTAEAAGDAIVLRALGQGAVCKPMRDRMPMGCCAPTGCC